MFFNKTASAKKLLYPLAVSHPLMTPKNLQIFFLMPDRELLKIDNLEVRFYADAQPENPVVSGFNLEIFPGETLALIGESGCGKTTVARAILRLIDWPGQITAGEIFYRGENLLAMPEKRLRQIRWKEIAMIFQEPAAALNPLRRLGPQITEVLRLHLGFDKKSAAEKALHLFESAGLPDAARCFGAYPHELSSGMRQRAMIAMAIACRPALIIADEPTAALDAHHQNEALACLQRLQHEYKMSLFFITHDIGLVAAWAHRVAIMQQGKIVEAEITEQILSQPKHPYTKKLLEAASRFR